jgi:hypothetical protein
MRQLQLFTTAELARMRDRTASRSHSPEAEEFRRNHERHRAWGLARRHAERLRRLREADLDSPARTVTAAMADPASHPPDVAPGQPTEQLEQSNRSALRPARRAGPRPDNVARAAASTGPINATASATTSPARQQRSARRRHRNVVGCRRNADARKQNDFANCKRPARRSESEFRMLCRPHLVENRIGKPRPYCPRTNRSPPRDSL